MLQNIDPVMVMTIALAVIGVFLAGQWWDIIRQSATIKDELLPEGLNLGDRNAVKQAADALPKTSLVALRLRNLLSAWASGTGQTDLVAMSAQQSARYADRSRAALWFAVLVFVGAFMVREFRDVAAMGLGMAGATHFLYVLMLSRMDGFIERAFLARVPGQIEGTALTADLLAEKLGGAIDAAFRNYVPQPEKLSAAVTAPVEAAVKGAAAGLEAAVKSVTAGLETSLKGATAGMEASLKSATAGLDASLKAVAAALDASNKKQLEAQDVMATKWSGYQKDTVTGLEAAKKALEAVTSQLTIGLGGSTDKWQGALSAHAQQVSQANQTLVAQLEKIQTLGKDIEKVFHVQQMVDGTIKAVTTTEEFKNTLTSLRAHIEQSDALIREVTKPRTIRLVEQQQAEAK